MSGKGAYILNHRKRTLKSYLAETWARRHITFHMAASLMRSRLRGHGLGILLIIAHPLILAGIFSLVFVKAFGVTDIEHFSLYVLTGVVVYDYVSNMVAGSLPLVAHAQPFTRQIRTPLLNFILPHWLHLSVVMMYGLAGTLAFAVIFRPEHINATLLVLPLDLLIVSLCVAPVGIFFALLGDRIKTIQPFITYGLLILYYLTPVFIPKSAFSNPILAMWIHVNPAAAAIELIRAPILDGAVPSAESYATIIFFGLICLVVDIFWLRAHERMN